MDPWSIFDDPMTTTRASIPELTKEHLDEMFEAVRKLSAEAAELKYKPIRFRKDGPLIYPRKNILLISEKFKGTKAGNALTWLAWSKVRWLSGPLDTGDIFAVPIAWQGETHRE